MNNFGRSGGFSRPDATLTPDQIMRQELSRGEKLIWADVPVSRRSQIYDALPRALFGIPFFAFAVFWTWMASSMLRGESNSSGIDGFDYIFPMFGIPFILVGLGLMLSPFWAVLKAGKATYALTDQRLLIRQGFPKIVVQSWPLDQVGQLTRTGAADGVGNVYFKTETVRGTKGRSYERKIGFIGINNPKKLEDAIRQQTERSGN